MNLRSSKLFIHYIPSVFDVFATKIAGTENDFNIPLCSMLSVEGTQRDIFFAVVYFKEGTEKIL